MSNGVNSDVGVTVKNTSDFAIDFILTNTYIANSLERVSKISEISILNHTNVNVSITDVNGIISKHCPVKLNSTFTNMVGIPIDAKYVYIVERRVISNDDLNNTIMLNKSKNHKGNLYNIIHTNIMNLPTDKKIKEIYVIYQVDIEYLKLKRRISLKEIGLSISIPGYEEIPYGHFHNALEIGDNDIDSKLFHNDIIYYHNDPKECIYINILNKTIRIDSIPIESEIEGEGIMMVYNDVNGVEKIYVKPKDFRAHNIYKSINEAKASMAKEEILANKKLDLELMNIESKFVTSITNDALTLHKNRLDVISKKNQILLDMEKVKAMKEKSSGMSTFIDNTKKYIDVILMIKKLILI